MIRIQVEPLDYAAATRALTAQRTDVGAVVTFLGLVRDYAADEAITALELEHYPGMTEAVLGDLVSQARLRWSLQEVGILHRVGRIEAGEPIVWVGVASAHRQAAFEACAFLMDFLKTRAPFWKREHGPAGSVWVAAKASDDQAVARWSPP